MTPAIILAVAVLIVAMLIINKKELDNELKALQEYSSTIPVEVVLPKKQDAVHIIEENGILRSGAKITVLSQTSGKALTVNGRVGECVKAGQALVAVERGVLESQFALAKAALDNARKDLERTSALVESDAVTPQQLEAARLAYQNALTNFNALSDQLDKSVIKAPVSGIIAERLVEKGNVVAPSQHAFTILELDRMIFSIHVSEDNLFKLEKGQKATITIDVMPGKTFSGAIHSVAIAPDLSGRYEVEIMIDNRDRILRAGLTGKARIKTPLTHPGLIIPRKCIEGSVNNARLYVLQGDSVVSRHVKALTVSPTEVLVTEGLSANERVILSGQINLEDGSRVKVVTAQIR